MRLRAANRNLVAARVDETPLRTKLG